jgi:hypothetical protein
MNEKRLVHGDDISVRGIVLFSLGLLSTVILTLLAMRLMFGAFLAGEVAKDPPRSPLADRNLSRLPPAPRLQTAPEEELRRLRAEEEETLRSYGWIDREAGRVRIPIERAMDLIAARGLEFGEPMGKTSDGKTSDAK